MSERAQLTSPVVRCCTGFHANQTRSQISKIADDVRSPQLPPSAHLAIGPDTVNLKNVLREIETDRGNLHRGRLPSVVAFYNSHLLAHQCRERGPSTPSGHSTLNIRKIMDEGQVLILDLSGMGDEPARLLVALVVSAFAQAAESRSGQREEERHDYTLYVDEFQNFATLAFARILSEARKWRLSLCLAHQFVSQLSDELQDAVLGNCGTVVSFRIGATDAPIIARAIDAPEQDLKDLGRGEAWVRVLCEGRPKEARRMTTRKVSPRSGHLKSAIRNTQHNYARPRRLVEEMLRGARTRTRERNW